MCGVCGRGISNKGRWFFLGLLAAVVLVKLLATSTAHAQDAGMVRYDTLPAKLDDREASRLYPAVAQALRSPAGMGAEQSAVDDYFAKNYLPMMTSYQAEDLADLAKKREKLFKTYIGGASSASTQQHLIELAFKFARFAVRGNFHPAVRYNAALMLGDLDQQLATATTPPVPLPAATTELLELIEQEKFNDIPVPESVKLGALIGLERHARYGIDPQLKDRLTKAMLTVLAAQAAPEDVDQNVHDWTRTLAAEVLANQYAKEPTQPIQDALTALIGDKDLGLDDRCTAAALMKKITYPAGGVQGEATVLALGQLSVDVVNEAAKLARKYQKEALDGGVIAAPRGGGYGGGGRGGYGGEGGYGGGVRRGRGLRWRRRLWRRLSGRRGHRTQVRTSPHHGASDGYCLRQQFPRGGASRRGEISARVPAVRNEAGHQGDRR